MISQADEVVKLADISLNSELKTIVALNAAAAKINKIHKVLLMVDLGDLREGV
jgi:predicted amino acid racemase